MSQLPLPIDYGDPPAGPWARLLAYLLRQANASPPHVYTKEFYGLKERLLAKYARLIGNDYQHIRQECWGWPGGDGCEGQYCEKCGGTGVFQEYWVRLERWTMAGRIFHRPAERISHEPEVATVIEGKIKHPHDYHVSRECLLWLTLLCAPRLWWDLVRSPCSVSPGWWPLCRAQKVIFYTLMFFKRFHVQCRRCEREAARAWRRVQQAEDKIERYPF